MVSLVLPVPRLSMDYRPRLSAATLTRLPTTVRRPRYDRSKLSVGLVHLGVGAFHRCHQQETLDDLLHLPGNHQWGECGINLRPPVLADLLGPQDGLYGRLLRDGDSLDVRVLGGIVQTIDAQPTGPSDNVVGILSGSSVYVVSLTVTEKGYCHVPSTGELDTDLVAVRADMAALRADPKAERATLQTAPAFLLASLARRRATNASLPTFLSCDNVPENGALLGGILATMADGVDLSFGDWVRQNVDVPNTMVDRIVPATRPDDLVAFSDITGLDDAAVVTGEPFHDWVIEDRFTGRRPRWEDVGVRMVHDVRPFEEMKFRVVNGTQSLLCYLGFLAGHEFMWQVMTEPRFVRLAERLLNREMAPTLRVPTSVDTAQYRRTLVDRLRNPAVQHRTQQIATDGSRKIGQRFLAPLTERLALGESSPVLALGVAAWMRYVSGVDEAGRPIAVEDPLSAQLLAIGVRSDGRADDLVDGYLGLEAVFPASLRANVEFVALLRASVRDLLTLGVRATVDRLLASST